MALDSNKELNSLMQPLNSLCCDVNCDSSTSNLSFVQTLVVTASGLIFFFFKEILLNALKAPNVLNSC